MIALGVVGVREKSEGARKGSAASGLRTSSTTSRVEVSEHGPGSAGVTRRGAYISHATVRLRYHNKVVDDLFTNDYDEARY